jgi:hypothetical protein
VNQYRDNIVAARVAFEDVDVSGNANSTEVLALKGLENAFVTLSNKTPGDIASKYTHAYVWFARGILSLCVVVCIIGVIGSNDGSTRTCTAVAFAGFAGYILLFFTAFLFTMHFLAGSAVNDMCPTMTLSVKNALSAGKQGSPGNEIMYLLTCEYPGGPANSQLVKFRNSAKHTEDEVAQKLNERKESPDDPDKERDIKLLSERLVRVKGLVQALDGASDCTILKTAYNGMLKGVCNTGFKAVSMMCAVFAGMAVCVMIMMKSAFSLRTLYGATPDSNTLDYNSESASLMMSNDNDKDK